MGFHILNIATTNTLVNHPIQPHTTINNHNYQPTLVNQSKLTYFESKIKFESISSTGYCKNLKNNNKKKLKIVGMTSAGGSVKKTEEEWRTILAPEQFRILREKGTEYPGTGLYNKFFDEGTYECAGCGTPLYKSTTKFDSGCGWPAFYEGLSGAINRTPDPDGRRTEITCAACGGHLGHVFKGERFPTPTDERHCVNSISLKFARGNSEPKL